MISTLTIIFFIFGLIIGSFLNVVIFRLNTEKSFNGRSACMSCKNQLRFYEMVPVLSFLGLRGRCRNCKTKISVQYPLVESITGVIFATFFLKFQNIFFMDAATFTVTYAYYTMMFSLLLVIAVYDFKHKIIPDALAFILGVLSFAGLFFFNPEGYFAFYPHIPSVLQFLSGILIAAPFALLWLVSSGNWMGLGDAKLAVGLGWLLGFSFALSGIMVAFWSGALLGIFLIIFSKKYGLKSEIPFAPYLVLGMFLAFIFELRLFSF